MRTDSSSRVAACRPLVLWILLGLAACVGWAAARVWPPTSLVPPRATTPLLPDGARPGGGDGPASAPPLATVNAPGGEEPAAHRVSAGASGAPVAEAGRSTETEWVESKASSRQRPVAAGVVPRLAMELHPGFAEVRDRGDEARGDVTEAGLRSEPGWERTEPGRELDEVLDSLDLDREQQSALRAIEEEDAAAQALAGEGGDEAVGVGDGGSAEDRKRAILGDEAYQRYEKLGDPAYRAIAGLAKERGLSEDTVEAAVEAHRAFVGVVRRAVADPERMQSVTLGDLARARRVHLDHLSGVLGEEVIGRYESLVLAPELPWGALLEPVDDEGEAEDGER